MGDYSSTAHDSEVVVAGPSRNLVRLPGRITGGRLSLMEMDIDPGWQGPPPHVHRVVDHLWYVLAGEVEVTVDGRTARHAAGDVAFVPAGLPHGFSTLHTSGVRMLQIDSPQSLDGYFRDLATALAAGEHPDPGDVAAIMARHDTTAVPLPGGS